MPRYAVRAKVPGGSDVRVLVKANSEAQAKKIVKEKYVLGKHRSKTKLTAKETR